MAREEDKDWPKLGEAISPREQPLAIYSPRRTVTGSTRVARSPGT